MVLSSRNRKLAKEIVAIGLKGLDAQAHSFFSKRIENNRSLMTRFFFLIETETTQLVQKS